MKDIINKLEHAVYLIEDPYTIGVLREAVEFIEKQQAQIDRSQKNAADASWENDRLRAEGAYDQGRDGWL